MQKLDQIDLAILRTLQENGRISNADLADRVGLSASSCSRRLDILEKSGVISGYHARVSHKALDYKMMVIVHISLSGQFAKTLAEFESAVKRVPMCWSAISCPANTTISSASPARTSRTTSASTATGCRRCPMWSRSTRPSRCARSSTGRTWRRFKGQENGCGNPQPLSKQRQNIAQEIWQTLFIQYNRLTSIFHGVRTCARITSSRIGYHAWRCVEAGPVPGVERRRKAPCQGPCRKWSSSGLKKAQARL